jgi:hypothetical protein
VKLPTYPPVYRFILINEDGIPRRYSIEDRADAMREWEETKVGAGITWIHGFLYVVPHGDMNGHLLYSF